MSAAFVSWHCKIEKILGCGRGKCLPDPPRYVSVPLHGGHLTSCNHRRIIPYLRFIFGSGGSTPHPPRAYGASPTACNVAFRTGHERRGGGCILRRRWQAQRVSRSTPGPPGGSDALIPAGCRPSRARIEARGEPGQARAGPGDPVRASPRQARLWPGAAKRRSAPE